MPVGLRVGAAKGLKQRVPQGENYGPIHLPCSVLTDPPFSFLSAAGGRAVPVERTLHVRASFMHKWMFQTPLYEQNLMEGSRTVIRQLAWGGGWGVSYPPQEECSFGQVRQRSLFVDEDDGGAYHIVLLLNELTYTS